MGQVEVLCWLKEKRKLSSKWYTIKEIKEGLEYDGMNRLGLKQVCKNLQKLSIFGIIEVRITGFWEQQKEFRAYI